MSAETVILEDGIAWKRMPDGSQQTLTYGECAKEIERLSAEVAHRQRYAAQMNDILKENARLRAVVRQAHQERDARTGLAPCSCIDCHPAGSSLTRTGE